MRPQKIRHIDAPPPWRRYLPEGRRDAAEVTLGLDMFEALRLVDAEGLSQEAAAARMGISPPTLCRLLAEARRRVATALRDGWALRCAGGSVEIRPGGGHGHRHGAQGGRAPGQGRHGQGGRAACPAAGEGACLAEARGRVMENPQPVAPEPAGPHPGAAQVGAGNGPRPVRRRGHGPGRDSREDV